MKIGLSDVEGHVLHGLLEETSGDIVIRLDRQGFIIHASANIADLGLDLSGALLLPHITDLADRNHAAFLGEHINAALAGRAQTGWTEFPVIACPERDTCRQAHCQRWYALSLRPMCDNTGTPDGAMCLMRSVQQVRSLEGELHARAVTDPLTGLANRISLFQTLEEAHSAASAAKRAARFRLVWKSPELSPLALSLVALIAAHGTSMRAAAWATAAVSISMMSPPRTRCRRLPWSSLSMKQSLVMMRTFGSPVSGMIAA